MTTTTTKNWEDLEEGLKNDIKRGFHSTISAIAGDLSEIEDAPNFIDVLDLSDMMACYSDMYSRLRGEAMDWLREATKGKDGYKNLNAAVKEWMPGGFWL